MNALLGDKGIMDWHRDVVKLFFPDKMAGTEFNELLRVAENGRDFRNHPSFECVRTAPRKSHHEEPSHRMSTKELLGGDFDAVASVGKSNVMEFKDGMSI